MSIPLLCVSLVDDDDAVDDDDVHNTDDVMRMMILMTRVRMGDDDEDYC